MYEVMFFDIFWKCIQHTIHLNKTNVKKNFLQTK